MLFILKSVWNSCINIKYFEKSKKDISIWSFSTIEYLIKLLNIIWIKIFYMVLKVVIELFNK